VVRWPRARSRDPRSRRAGRMDSRAHRVTVRRPQGEDE
jgi:hypothetical protein